MQLETKQKNHNKKNLKPCLVVTNFKAIFLKDLVLQKAFRIK